MAKKQVGFVKLQVPAGAANPGRPYPINAQFEVTIPNGKVVTAVTGGNWEGSGVKPDIVVSASAGRETAHRRALARLLSETAPGPRHDTLREYLQAMDASQHDETARP